MEETHTEELQSMGWTDIGEVHGGLSLWEDPMLEQEKCEGRRSRIDFINLPQPYAHPYVPLKGGRGREVRRERQKSSDEVKGKLLAFHKPDQFVPTLMEFFTFLLSHPKSAFPTSQSLDLISGTSGKVPGYQEPVIIGQVKDRKAVMKLKGFAYGTRMVQEK
ncbi:hypothetical protein HGM15179_016037 [Zosterops borbonicus]|uniref:Uncharacterized protein n=1 Tax=Zosterops borbonicus TaxID=364589 RepID=A0A8K1G3J8_9PASS|nr:hypothetical protein HGM15179_016037 [Zosterops borbonicus]